jgi:GNAT superfamily N-acetyltransferase
MADVEIRRATETDLPQVLELARRALGWTDDDDSFLVWKHLQNPFGASPMWVALDGAQVVGFRSFLRWEFVTADGRIVRAARAVDTATDPQHQGRGIFTRLTRTAIAELPGDGVELIFNTPNEKSLPGYLKLGWTEVGRLPVAVMPTSWRFPRVVATARRAAGRAPAPSAGGEPARDVLGASGIDELLAALPSRRGLATRRTRDYLSWRFGNEVLGYRVVLVGASVADGAAVFRVRQRGHAVEAVLCEVLVPGGDARAERSLVRRVARSAGADYLLRLDDRLVTADPFARLPRIGPVLAARSLGTPAPDARSAWSLTMGDVELF